MLSPILNLLVSPDETSRTSLKPRFNNAMAHMLPAGPAPIMTILLLIELDIK